MCCCKLTKWMSQEHIRNETNLICVSSQICVIDHYFLCIDTCILTQTVIFLQVNFLLIISTKLKYHYFIEICNECHNFQVLKHLSMTENHWILKWLLCLLDYVDDYDDALMFYFILLFGIFTNLLLLFFLFSPLSSDHRSSCKYICWLLALLR